jgi:hypothetical protein
MLGSFLKIKSINMKAGIKIIACGIICTTIFINIPER